MRKFLAFMLSVPTLGASFVFSDFSIAQQNCRMVTIYKTERWWNGRSWSSSQMPYFERVCDGVGSGSPQIGDEVSKGKFFRDGRPYIDRKYYYGAYVVTPDGKPLDIRSGPGRNYPVIDQVPNGVFLSMTGDMKQDSTGESWTELHTKTWVYTKYTR